MLSTLDPEVMLELRALGEEFFDDLLRTFLEQSEKTIDKLATALYDDDAPAFSRAAHLLVGASLNIGATRMAELARAAELTAPADAHVEALREELTRVARMQAPV